MTTEQLNSLMSTLKEFSDERDWDKFHTPKNLAAALSVEASELLEIFQWLTDKQSAELTDAQLANAQDEIGDILIYLLRLSDKLGIDLIEAACKKHQKNIDKYPAEKVRGSAAKYTEYE